MERERIQIILEAVANLSGFDKIANALKKAQGLLDNLLEKAKESASGIVGAFERAGHSLYRIFRQVAVGGRGAFKRISDAAGRAFSAAGRSGANFVAGTALGLGRLLGSFNVLGMAVNLVGTAFRVVFSVASSLVRAVVSAIGALVSRVLDLAGRLAGVLVGAAQRGFQAIVVGAVAAKGALIALLTYIGKVGVDTNLSLDRVSRSLRIITRSASEASGMIGEMQQYAKEASFSFLQIADWGTKLRAVGFTAREVIPIIRTFGDAAVGLKGPGAEGLELMNRFVDAFGKLKARGRVTEESIEPFVTAGLPIRQILGVPEGADLGSMNISAAQAMPKILAALTAQFGGLQKAASSSLEGVLNNLGDVIEILSGYVTRGLLGSLTRAAQAVLDFMDNLENTEKGQIIIKGFSDLFSLVGYAVEGLAAKIPLLVDWLAQAFESGRIHDFIQTLVNGVLAAWTWLKNFVAWMFTNWPVVWSNAKALFSWFVNVVRTGLQWIATNWKVVWDTAVALFTKVAKIVGMLVAGLIAVWGELHNTQRSGVGILEALGEGFKSFALVAVQAVVTVISALAKMQMLIGASQVAMGALVAALAPILKKPGMIAAGTKLAVTGSGTFAAGMGMFLGAKIFGRQAQRAISGIDIGETFAAAQDRLRNALQSNRFGAAFMRGARRFGEEFDRFPFRAFGLDLPGGRLTPLPRIPAMPGWVWPQFAAATGAAQVAPAPAAAPTGTDWSRFMAQPPIAQYPAGATIYVPSPQVEVNVYGSATPEEVGKAVTDKLREEQARLGIRPR